MAELADALVLGSSGQPCRFKSCYPHQIKRRYEKWTFFLECPISHRRFLCTPKIGWGFAKSPNSAYKDLKNNFWTLMSVFLSPLACRNIWFHKPPAFCSPAWNVDVLYYRNLCICQRILWIPVRNGRCGDTIPLVLKKQRTIPAQHCGRACLMAKRIAPHAVSSAASERKTMYISCLNRYGRSVLPVAFVPYTPFGMSRWQAGRCAFVRFCSQLLFWNINRESQRYNIFWSLPKNR